MHQKQIDVKNIFFDSIVFNSEKCDIKHTCTPTKHVPNTEKSIIKHTITPTQYGLDDSILSQSDIIQVHQQKVKTLAELERKIR